MNKLKWIPLNEEIKVDYPMAMDINKNVVQFVHFDKNVVFLFINNYMVVLLLNLMTSKVELNIANVFPLRTFLPNEHIVKVIQNRTEKDEFLFVTSQNNITLLSFSGYNFYYEERGEITFPLKKINAFQYIDYDIYMTMHNDLYKYKTNELREELIKPNVDAINIHVNDVEIILFSKKDIQIYDSHLKTTKIVFTYPEMNMNFSGFFYCCKIYYIKSHEEIGIYDCSEQTHTSMKFSSKKILNKTQFQKIIYVNEDIIVATNPSEVELYVYSQKNNTFNRETSIIDNKCYVVVDDYIFCLGLNSKTMCIKGKFTIWNKSKKSEEPKAVETYDKSLIDSLSTLEEIEDTYEQYQQSLIKAKTEVTNHMSIINKLIEKYSKVVVSYCFFDKFKHLIKSHINKINEIVSNYKEDKSYETLPSYFNEIYSKLIIQYGQIFGFHFIPLNYKEVYVNYFINETLHRTYEMIIISKDTKDYQTYIRLSKLYNKLNRLLF